MPLMKPAPVGLGPAISFITLGVDRSRTKSSLLRGDGARRPSSKQSARRVLRCRRADFRAVSPRRAGGDAASVPGSTETTITMSLSQNVASESDVDSLLAAGGDAGGTVLREPSAPPWGGIRGYFADPDGFAWEVAWNPGVPSMPTGASRSGREDLTGLDQLAPIDTSTGCGAGWKFGCTAIAAGSRLPSGSRGRLSLSMIFWIAMIPSISISGRGGQPGT